MLMALHANANKRKIDARDGIDAFSLSKYKSRLVYADLECTKSAREGSPNVADWLDNAASALVSP